MCPWQWRSREQLKKGGSGQPLRCSWGHYTTGWLTGLKNDYVLLWKNAFMVFGTFGNEKRCLKSTNKMAVNLLIHQTLHLHKHLWCICTGSTLALTEGAGHVANQSEVFLEADLSIVVLIQSLHHLLNGRGAVCILNTKGLTEADGKYCVNSINMVAPCEKKTYKTLLYTNGLFVYNKGWWRRAKNDVVPYLHDAAKLFFYQFLEGACA